MSDDNRETRKQRQARMKEAERLLLFALAEGVAALLDGVAKPFWAEQLRDLSKTAQGRQ